MNSEDQYEEFIRKRSQERSLTFLVIVIMIGSLMIAGYRIYKLVPKQTFSNRSMMNDCDDLYDVIRGELVTAADVELSKKKPAEGNWHCFYVNNGKFYKDGKLVKGKNWYRHRSLTITYVAYIRNQSRIDFKIKLVKYHQSYSQRSTIELLDMNLKNHIKKSDATGEESYTLAIDDSKNNPKKYKLYYKGM
jgi:hypothetical protein